MAHVLMWTNVWYMVVYSITFKQSVVVATMHMFAYLSAFIANDASGLCPSLFEEQWTIGGTLEDIFSVVLPFLAPFIVTLMIATATDQHRRMMNRTHELLVQHADALLDAKR